MCGIQKLSQGPVQPFKAESIVNVIADQAQGIRKVTTTEKNCEFQLAMTSRSSGFDSRPSDDDFDDSISRVEDIKVFFFINISLYIFH